MEIGLIIAAGKQTRFKSDTPKSLSKINGEIIAKHNYDVLSCVCDKVYIVTSDNFYSKFKEVFDDDSIINIGKSGIGSGHAVMKACTSIKDMYSDTNIFICWGDTYLDINLVLKVLREHKDYVTIPVENVENPYTEFYLSDDDYIKVKFSKYGDEVGSPSLHDLSLFYCNINLILDSCRKFHEKYFNENFSYNHPHGNEFEFLDIFNEYNIKGNLLEVKDIDSYSFNTLEELNKINESLKGDR